MLIGFTALAFWLFGSGEEESAEEATIEEVVATDIQTAEENTLTLEEASVCDTLD